MILWVLWEWLDVRTTCFFPKLNKGGRQVLLNISSDRPLPSVTPRSFDLTQLPAAEPRVYTFMCELILYTQTGTCFVSVHGAACWSLARLCSVFMCIMTLYTMGRRMRKNRKIRAMPEKHQKQKQKERQEDSDQVECVLCSDLLHCSQQWLTGQQ